MPPKKKEKRLQRGEVRTDEDGNPLLVVETQVKYFCHSSIDDEIDGEIVPIKFKTTTAFFKTFNRKVVELLEESISTANEDGRTLLRSSDVPDT